MSNIGRASSPCSAAKYAPEMETGASSGQEVLQLCAVLRFDIDAQGGSVDCSDGHRR